MQARVALIITGLVILLITFLLYTGRKLIIKIAMFWNVFGLAMVVLGILPIWKPNNINLEGPFGWTVAVLFYMVLIGLFSFSVHLSQSINREKELTMHVSLLNQENQKLLKEMAEVRDLLNLKEINSEGDRRD